MKPSRGFVKNHVDLGDEAQVDTDSSFGFRKLPNQSVVKYSAHEYVRGDVHAKWYWIDEGDVQACSQGSVAQDKP